MHEVPAGRPVSGPVTLVSTTRIAPIVRQATVVASDGETYEVELGRTPGTFEKDEEVVLDFGAEDAPLVLARVLERDGKRLRLQALRSRQRDKREYPRMSAGIRLRYRRASRTEEDESCRAWLERGVHPSDEERWHEPDPFMDFSASGFNFEDRETCEAGDLLLLELFHPRGAGSWRALARVIRIHPLSPDEAPPASVEGEATHGIAVDLLQVPVEARQALMSFTMELQEGTGESAVSGDESGADRPPDA